MLEVLKNKRFLGHFEFTCVSRHIAEVTGSNPVAPIRVCKPPTRRLVAFGDWACDRGIAIDQRAVARRADKSFKFSRPRDSSGWVIYRDAAGLAVWLGLARSAACGWPVCVAGDRTIRKEAAYGVADAG